MTLSVPESARLFGINKSNRDFSNPESWGKNQFNSSFPVALCCYMASKNLEANYLIYQHGAFHITTISFSELFGTNPLSDDTYFGFETAFSVYDQYSLGFNPRTDLVVSQAGAKPAPTAALEIKLTALPDSTTSELSESEYGSELVIRPDTIYYLAAGLAHHNMQLVRNHFAGNPIPISDWSDPAEILLAFDRIHLKMSALLNDPGLVANPNILQPVWKTIGKSPQLAPNCLDVFAWGTSGFLYFLLEITRAESHTKVSRSMRSLVWAYKMLTDIQASGQTNFQDTIDRLSFNTKNDKAFATSGTITHSFMKHENLTRPRITRSEIKSIILGGGQNMLSPERRFDAILVGSPELFR